MLKNINIRNVSLEDIDKLLEIYSYYVKNTAITFECDIPSKKEFENRILEITKKYPYLVLELDDVVVGYTYANKFKDRVAYDYTVETSIYLDNNLKGLGLGKILHQEIEKKLKELGFVTIEACITYPNYESIEFHKRNGYTKVAHFNKVGYKFNNWYDVVWYEKAINPHNIKENK